MNDLYSKWYSEFSQLTDVFGSDELYNALESLLNSSRNTFAFNRKLMEKAIDVSWVEAIENGITHVDNFLRNPRRTIEDVEEIVPIALSRKTTIESVKHLAQHTLQTAFSTAIRRKCSIRLNALTAQEAFRENI